MVLYVPDAKTSAAYASLVTEQKATSLPGRSEFPIPRSKSKHPAKLQGAISTSIVNS
jgi:hypothetical protein